MSNKSMILTEAKCDLCKGALDYKDMVQLGKWVFHSTCHEIVAFRLTNFMNILLLPQAEFDEWLEDDGQ